MVVLLFFVIVVSHVVVVVLGGEFYMYVLFLCMSFFGVAFVVVLGVGGCVIPLLSVGCVILLFFFALFSVCISFQCVLERVPVPPAVMTICK